MASDKKPNNAGQSQSDDHAFLSKEQVHQLVTNRLNNFRHLAWEDDVSRNALDTEPFENLSSVQEMLGFMSKSAIRQIVGEDIEEYVARDSHPIPCADDREGYSKNNNARYWLVGLKDYLDVCRFASKFSVPLNSVFDFGCASGRVLRHFANQSDAKEVWGSDINARHVRWLCDHMPSNVRAIANSAYPNLPMKDEYFDVITAFSVFTHIDAFETAWLAELKRTLRPGGLFYATIHNEDTWRMLRDELDNENNRLLQTMLSMEPSVKEKLKDELPEGRLVYRFTHLGPYRAHVFHSNSYIKNVWGRFFEIVEILPCHHNRQSVVIMR